MAESSGEVSLRYVGIFDYYGVYSTLVSWLQDNNFGVHFPEYKDKPSGPGMRERTYKLMGEKKVDEYYKWIVNIEVQCFDGSQVMIDYPGGRRVPMHRAKLFIKIMGEVDEDHQNLFKSPMQQKVKKFLRQYVYKNRIGGQNKKPLNEGIIVLHKQLKSMLHMDAQGGQ